MRIGFILLVGLILMFPCVQTQNIEVEFFFEKPYFVAGGQNVYVGVLLLNKSDDDLEDIFAQLLLSYPFNPSVATAPSLRSDQYSLRKLEKNSSKKIIFKLDVDQAASYGDYEIPLIINYTMQNTAYQESFTIPLHIVGETLVDIMEVNTDTSVEVGHEFGVEMKVSNVGKTSIDWLKVSLSIDENSSVISKESSEKIFRNLKSGGTITVHFKLAARRDIDPDNYLIPVVLTYQDEAKQVYESREAFGITILGKAEVDIAGIKMTPEQIRAGDRVTLAIQLDNTGSGDAKAVSGVLSSPSFTLQSYSGEIKKGDSGALFFSFVVPEDAGTKATLILAITYQDDFGSHRYEKPVEMTLEEKEGTQGGTMFGGIAAAALVVVLLLWFWRRRAKK